MRVGVLALQGAFREHLEMLRRLGQEGVEVRLPADLAGPFDVVVSARAIHHLPADDKRKLFTDIRDRLVPGGAFINIDNTRPADEFFRPLR